MPFFISGKEIAEQKEKDHVERVRILKNKRVIPKLVIIQTVDSPVIDLYVRVKKKYAEKIGIDVEHILATPTDIEKIISKSNIDEKIHGIIIQLPLDSNLKQDTILNLITKDKDVDGLCTDSTYTPPTVQAILWLIEKYVENFTTKKIALVGKGRLVGSPLSFLLEKKKVLVDIFTKGDDLTNLRDYDLIISATGVPNLILNTYVPRGGFLFDAGTAEENGSIHGDASDELYEREDIHITPTKGGVGILTVRALFENVIKAAEN